MDRISGTSATSSTPSIIRAARRYDNRLAVIAAARHFNKDIGAILVVGGETFSLITFKGDGGYQSFSTNTSCAAGTGSFLDQQARRLNLHDTKELSDRAFSNSLTIPGIASRCAVFSKTDLVHAQQEGYTLAQICDGLCHGLARNITGTLSMDRDLLEPVIFTGVFVIYQDTNIFFPKLTIIRFDVFFDVLPKSSGLLEKERYASGASELLS